MNDSPSFPTIPGYKISSELGSGGMATVYRGIQEKLNRQVAVKVLSPVLLADKTFASRFLKEAHTAASLSHSNIVSVYDVGQEDHHLYIVMEYLSPSLKEFIHSGRCRPEEALKVLKGIGSALDYAHNKGFIHRDIKPDNIMFREDGTPVLTDFGIARAIGSATKLTKTGMSIGTPHYMSPEQARGKTLDGRSDLYSLGIVFHEMLTGRVPYEAEDSIAIAVKHIQEPIPELPSHLSQYQSLLNKLLAKEPVDRFQTGSELVSVLENPLGRAEASAAPTNFESRIPNHGFSDQPASFTTTPGQEGRRSKVEGQPASSGDYAGSGGSRVTDHAFSPIPNPDPPTRKPLVIGLGIALAVLVVILIAVMNQGKKEPERSGVRIVAAAPSGIPAKPSEDPVVKQNQVYDGHIASARRALSSSDLDTAAREIDRAKAIRSGNEVALLEDSLRLALEKKRQAERAEVARKEAAEQKRQEEETQRKAEVQRQARELAAARAAEEEKRRSLGIEMVRISGGTFQMGSNSSEAYGDEKPVHSVSVSTFYLSKTEVTQGQWKAVMGNNPSSFQKGDNYPVEQVSWEDCQEFIRKLNQKTGKRYRLPTEAEWEYAARGGNSSDRYGYVDRIAWYNGNSGGSTHPVAQKQANSYGLYDMLGNVYEWCQDWHGDYSSSSQDNPTGPYTGSIRVFRGGSWYFTARLCRAPIRYWYSPDLRNYYLGFRLAAVSL